MTSIWDLPGPRYVPLGRCLVLVPRPALGRQGVAQPEDQTSKDLAVLSYCLSRSPWWPWG